MKTRPVNKTELTLEELTAVLELYNASKDLIENMQERFTCTIDQVSRLQTEFCRVGHALDFKPRKSTHDPDTPMHWADYVLPGDKNAFFTDYQQSQWETPELEE